MPMNWCLSVFCWIFIFFCLLLFFFDYSKLEVSMNIKSEKMNDKWECW